MKRIYSATVALAALLLACSPVSAANISQGVSEISGDLNLSYDFKTQNSAVSPQYGTINKSETDTYGGQIRLGYGYFITDEIQVGATASESISASKPYQQGTPASYTAETFQTSFDATAKYHFLQLTRKQIPVVPYIGAQLGYVNYHSKQKNQFNKQQEEYDANSLGIGGMGGLKIFVTENMAINTEFNYKHFQVELLKGVPQEKHNQFIGLIGLSYYFDK
jgi:opacity protein-like surface antigen